MYIFFISLFSLVCIAVMPFFLIEQRTPSYKSLILKMVCSTMFLLCGLFAYKYTGGGRYAAFMTAGLACSWLGDLGLHVPGKLKNISAVIGVAAFAAAHVMYLIAYHNELRVGNSDFKFITVRDILIVIAACAAYLLVLKLTKTDFTVLLIPLAIYFVALILMCIKAITLAITIKDTNAVGAVFLIIGSVFFVLSDTSLGLLMFNKKIKANFPFKIYNIVTYFVGQLLLAATILFI